MKKQPILAALQKASKGLVLVSETEAKLEPFLWADGGDSSREHLLELMGSTPGTPVAETSLDTFLRVVPKEDMARFGKLTKALQDQLTEVKVYTLGEEAEKQVYIVGKTQDSQWAGVRTVVVET